jgi:hypothetical protein
LARLQEDQAERDAKRDDRELRQNRWQLVQLVIALATIAGVIAAFIFGYRNLREQQAALTQGYENLKQQQQAAGQQDQESRYSSISEIELDVDTAIADHPRLISCFTDVTCNAKPPLTSEELQQAAALAVYIVDFYQYLYDQLENLNAVPNNGRFTLLEKNIPGVNRVVPGYSNENWITWSETIFDGFEYSTLVCDALQGDANAYEQEFVHAVAVTHVCPNLKDPGPSPWWTP